MTSCRQAGMMGWVCWAWSVARVKSQWRQRGMLQSEVTVETLVHVDMRSTGCSSRVT